MMDTLQEDLCTFTIKPISIRPTMRYTVYRTPAQQVGMLP
jgi:hypothetical protein